MKDDIMDWLDSWGYRLGYGLICLPILWDILYRGGRESNIAIGDAGVFMQIWGLIIVAISEYCTKKLDKKTKPRR